MTTPSKSTQENRKESYLVAGSEGYLDQLYETYLKDPNALSEEWQAYFQNLIGSNTPTESHLEIQKAFRRLAQENVKTLVPTSMSTHHDAQQERVIELINNFRRFGHLKATIDPLNLGGRLPAPSLELNYYGFDERDLEQTFNIQTYQALRKKQATLKTLLQSLKAVYSGNIGFEYMHISRNDEVVWIQDRIENEWAHFSPSAAEKKHILNRLIVADGLEKYLGNKYVGQKRFGLEGGDALIPMLDTIVNQGTATGVKEMIIGMAHRGRLNVLVNIVGKSPDAIFAAFEGRGVSESHSGDVKYHLGYSSNVRTPNGDLHIALAFNPSHLEIVSPVVQGSVRARQRRRRDTDHQQVLPVEIHGDAAFSAQGVVMETFSMSQTRWFTVGGSVHIVINNQIGFTISNPLDSRSSLYCTDSAKMIEAPVLHVNGNDPEAIYFAAKLAIDYRQLFKRDIVIDLVCYRRHGHNEADEPSATQPIMYKVIKAMPVPYQIYAKKLIEEGIVTEDEVKQQVSAYRDALDESKKVVDVVENNHEYEYMVNWEPYLDQPWDLKTDTSVPAKTLEKLADKLTTLPDGFVMQPQVKKNFEAMKKMAQGTQPLNWGYAETMAYATLLEEGYPIRLCGQDAARGTFAHRHAVLHDQNTSQIYIPLSHISPKQAQINIVDSLLSEEGVLAFEYGYASAEPNYLVIWEAQFGDFANGAQVVIDQFISSGEQKWGRLCGLTMLLPHGYEGQGPEHSSARLERYLQLCAQDNMQVCVPSTPAQIFHLLRRQMVRPYRKPLIVMSPKSLLRNPLAVSSLDDLSQGQFRNVIPEVDDLELKKVDRLILCAGKIYYELLANRRKQEIVNIALVRIEQLYPFPHDDLKKVLKDYKHVKDVIWCQEEPQNQGAWSTIQTDIESHLTPEQHLRYVGRKSAASPAVGYHVVHEKEQEEIISLALTKKEK